MLLLTLAAETVSTTGLSTTDRAVVGGVGLAVSAIITFATTKILPLLKQFSDAQTKTSNSIESFSNSQAVLTWILRGYYERYAKCKKTILIIEDSPVDGALVGMVCMRLARKYDLKVIDVPNLTNSYEYIPEAKIVILDVCLPDASEEMVAEFVRHCPCDVIIYSGGNHARDAFPGAFAVLKKGDANQLYREMESAITGARTEGLAESLGV